MPTTSRNKNKETLLKTTLKKQLGNESSSFRLRSRSSKASKNSTTLQMSAGKDVLSTDEEEDISATDVRAAVKDAVNNKRKKTLHSDDPEVSNKENADVNNIVETSPSALCDSGKSIDHVTARKNLSTITELQMKHQSLLTIIKEMGVMKQRSSDSQQISLGLQNQCEILQNQCDEFMNVRIDERLIWEKDQVIIKGLKSKSTEKQHKIEEQSKEIERLSKRNTELEEKVSALSVQIDELQQAHREKVDLEKKSDQEILDLKEENINRAEEIKHLNQLLRESKEQVLVLEELNNKLLEEKGTVEQRMKDQDRERKDSLDRVDKEVVVMEAWKKELVGRTQNFESQLDHLENLKCKLEVKVSTLIAENKEHENVNKKLKEYQLELEESNRKTLQEYEKTLSCHEQNVLELLLPNAQTRSPAYFFVQDSIKTWIKNCNEEPNLMALYKQLIYDLQDVTDFYSLLSGVSVWKVVEDTANIDLYHCQLNPVLGCGNYRFVMKVHSEEGTVGYSPEAVEIETLKSQLPKGLVDPAIFPCDRAFVFLRNMLEQFGQLSN